MLLDKNMRETGVLSVNEADIKRRDPDRCFCEFSNSSATPTKFSLGR
jgi:hypothetical protein